MIQVVDASISESIFNMLEGCVPEYVHQGIDRPPSGSTISGMCSSLDPAFKQDPLYCSHIQLVSEAHVSVHILKGLLNHTLVSP